MSSTEVQTVISDLTNLVGNVVPLEKWRCERLDDLCEKGIETHDPRTNPTTEFRYIDISSVDNRRKKIIEAKRLWGHDAPSRARQVVKKNDVIIATTRPNLNAVAMIPNELNDGIC